MMKNKMTRLLTAVLAIIGICLCTDSCRDSQLIDETEFNLFYPGLTDVGPGMDNVNIELGSYIGAQPSDFAISGIKFNGETFQDSEGVFSIDAAEGTLNLGKTSSLAIGQYAVSISCMAGGKSWNFPDIIIINMMKPVPEEIKVDPSEFTIKMIDVINGYFVPENYTAQIYSDSEAISITEYDISEVKLNGETISGDAFFSVSEEGVVSMDINEDTTPGVYQVSFKLITQLTDDKNPEEGLFADALTVTLASAPTDIIYPFLPVKVEENGIARTSETPSVTGSQVDLAFELAAISPEYAGDNASADWISIDPATGAINIKEGHPFVNGDSFRLDITVTNDNGTTTFPDACQIEVVDKVDEVSGVSYDPVEIVRGQAVIADVKIEAGDDVTYSFENLPAELSELKIDEKTGRISLQQGELLPEGNYSINIIARNYKNSVTAVFSLTVDANPYYFTTVSWGTNLDDAHADDPAYANQFRYTMGTSNIAPVSIKSGDYDKSVSKLTFNVSAKTKGAPNISIDNDGNLSLATRKSANRIDIYIITVTNGKGEKSEYSVDIPLFIHSCAKEGDKDILYTPLVARINPISGGNGHAATLVGFTEDEKARFHLDYRRNFVYQNLNGPASHISNMTDDTNFGKDHTANENGETFFLAHIWKDYWETYAGGTSTNCGSKTPVSYCANSGSVKDNSNGTSNSKNLNTALCYINPEIGYGVTVNARKFVYDNSYADGLFFGQMTWIIADEGASESTIEDKINNGNQVFPLVIWFDPDYEN